MKPGEVVCPRCGGRGHPAGGLNTAKWEYHREPVSVDGERVAYRQGYRLSGTMRFICEAGHVWTQARPPHLMAQRPKRARPRRGF